MQYELSVHQGVRQNKKRDDRRACDGAFPPARIMKQPLFPRRKHPPAERCGNGNQCGLMVCEHAQNQKQNTFPLLILQRIEGKHREQEGQIRFPILGVHSVKIGFGNQSDKENANACFYSVSLGRYSSKHANQQNTENVPYPSYRPIDRKPETMQWREKVIEHRRMLPKPRCEIGQQRESVGIPNEQVSIDSRVISHRSGNRQPNVQKFDEEDRNQCDDEHIVP